jgi:uroporphyrinogen-III synthase
MPDVVLLRSPDDASSDRSDHPDRRDRYVRAFREIGMDAVCEPALQFHYPRPDVLHLRLSQRDRYGGLVVTSPRALTAVSNVFGEDDAVRQAWIMARTYTVGPRTAARARELDLHPRGEEAGSAGALVKVIEADAPSRPLLFLSGDRRRDALPDGLSHAGVAFDELEVYRTEVRTGLRLPPDASWLAVFSPSGLDALERSGVDLSAVRLAAIGPTTARHLRDAGHAVAAVAPEPTPQALAGTIRQADGES